MRAPRVPARNGLESAPQRRLIMAASSRVSRALRAQRCATVWQGRVAMFSRSSSSEARGRGDTPGGNRRGMHRSARCVRGLVYEYASPRRGEHRLWRWFGGPGPFASSRRGDLRRQANGALVGARP